MTLRVKTLAITALTLGTLLVLLYLTARVILLDNYNQLEEQKVTRDMKRTVSALDNNISNLRDFTGDWAGWDDTYQFVVDTNEKYVWDNLQDGTFIGQRLNLILVINAEGQMVYSRAYDLENRKEMQLPRELEQHLTKKSPLLQHLNTSSQVSGIVMLSQGPLLLASRPIISSQLTGPIRGSLIMGRFLDSRELNRLSDTTLLNLSMEPYEQFKKGVGQGGGEPVLDLQKNFAVQPVGTDVIAGYALVKDLYGGPALVLKSQMPREIYSQGRASLRWLLLSLLALCLAAGFSSFLLLEKMVLQPLYRMGRAVASIGPGGRRDRVPLAGRDELSILAGALNDMLDRLSQSQAELLESEARQRLITENMLDIICHADTQGKIMYVSPSVEAILGYTPEGLEGRSIFDYIHPEDLPYARRRFSQGPFSYPSYRHELRLIHCGGHPLWFEALGNPIFDEGRRAAGFILCSREISQRKEMEEKLRYFSLHDSLTGLCNRSYFEQEMGGLQGGRPRPAGIIVCDVDGLKLINDTLGHGAGDSLLSAAAGVISAAFRGGDMVARIGGDEFAVLLLDCHREEMEVACQGLKEAVEQHNLENTALPLSISIGCAWGDGVDKGAANIFKEADNNMYREKLHRSQSARSAIVQTLKSAMKARDFITEGHGDRLQSLVAGLAEAIVRRRGREVSDLKLLAQFHDIGKVGIPDRILFKPGPLTREEKEEMQRHCEMGHRIALASPDLAPIAQWILKHHEWWDGSGYPLGLKGEEIPLECRILSIADAYDAMTSHRPYRSAMTPREALAELKRCAGLQFDPGLVPKFISLVEGEAREAPGA